jgi:hypothetical protein
MDLRRLDVPRAAAPLAYLALALLIYFDALLTYIAVGHLGAYVVVLSFIYRTPSAIWLVAAAKNAGVLYLALRGSRHPWLDCAALALLLWHAAVVYNGIAGSGSPLNNACSSSTTGV